MNDIKMRKNLIDQDEIWKARNVLCCASRKGPYLWLRRHSWTLILTWLDIFMDGKDKLEMRVLYQYEESFEFR